MTLTNCTISGNAADYGGAISNSGDKLIIASTTIAGNKTAAGRTGSGGINNYGTITATNTIIALNENANCFDEGTMHSAGHNLESADDCGFDATGDLVNTDPHLGPLQDNGGHPTSSGQAPRTHALQGGSPAIDAGTGVDCPTTDQRGVARPVDGDLDETATCDIGAYEFEPIDVYLHLAIRQSKMVDSRSSSRYLADFRHLGDFYCCGRSQTLEKPQRHRFQRRTRQPLSAFRPWNASGGPSGQLDFVRC
jgi:hypothetical protein